MLIGIEDTRKNIKWMDIMVSLSVTEEERIGWVKRAERTRRQLRFLETCLEVLPELAEEPAAVQGTKKIAA